MVVTLDIPDDDREFRAFKGRELTHFIDDGYLYEKTISCNLCGRCCMERPPGVPLNSMGYCVYLIQMHDEYECNNQFVPFNCIKQDPTQMDYCCIKHKKVKLG